MVPIGNSMVYLRPMYVSPTTNPQPQLQYVVAVLGQERADRHVAVGASCPTCLQHDGAVAVGDRARPSTGTVPAAVAGFLQQAQTDYTNALAALEGAEPGRSSRPTSRPCRRRSRRRRTCSGRPRRARSTTTTTTTTPPRAKKRRRRPSTTHDHDERTGRRRTRAERSAATTRRRRRRPPRSPTPLGGATT